MSPNAAYIKSELLQSSFNDHSQKYTCQTCLSNNINNEFDEKPSTRSPSD